MGETFNAWEVNAGFEIKNLRGDLRLSQGIFDQPRAFDIDMLDNKNAHGAFPWQSQTGVALANAGAKTAQSFIIGNKMSNPCAN